MLPLSDCLPRPQFDKAAPLVLCPFLRALLVTQPLRNLPKMCKEPRLRCITVYCNALGVNAILTMLYVYIYIAILFQSGDTSCVHKQIWQPFAGNLGAKAVPPNKEKV